MGIGREPPSETPTGWLADRFLAGGQVGERRCGEGEGPSKDLEKGLVGPAYTGRQQVRVGTLPTSNKGSGGGAEQIWRANEDQSERC